MSYMQENDMKLKTLCNELSIELDDFDEACFPDAQIVSTDEDETWEVIFTWPATKVYKLNTFGQLSTFLEDHKEYFRQDVSVSGL